MNYVCTSSYFTVLEVKPHLPPYLVPRIKVNATVIRGYPNQGYISTRWVYWCYLEGSRDYEITTNNSNLM